MMGGKPRRKPEPAPTWNTPPEVLAMAAAARISEALELEQLDREIARVARGIVGDVLDLRLVEQLVKTGLALARANPPSKLSPGHAAVVALLGAACCIVPELDLVKHLTAAVVDAVKNLEHVDVCSACRENQTKH